MTTVSIADDTTTDMAADDTTAVTAADDTTTDDTITDDMAADEPVAKKPKCDDSVLKYGGPGARFKDLSLQQKINIYDFFCAQKAKGVPLDTLYKRTCMGKSAYYRMDKNINAIIRLTKNQPWELTMNTPLGQLLPKDIVISAEEVKEVTSNERQILSMEKSSAQEAFRNNAKLMLYVLKDLEIQDGSVADLTNGEGQFTASLGQHFTIHRFDKYKHCERSPNQYPGVFSYESNEFHRLVETGGVAVVIVDPPYQSMAGGYNLHNCNWENSQSRVNFNDRYGISFPYTFKMIHCFYLKGFQLAGKLLKKDGGKFLVKLMNKNGDDDLRQAVLRIADCCGFKHQGDPYEVKSGSGASSYLYVFVRRSGSKDVSFATLYLGRDEADSLNEKFILKMQLSAGKEYLLAGRKLVDKANKWIEYYNKISAKLTDDRRNAAVKDIAQSITGAISSFGDNKNRYTSIFDEGAEIRTDSWEQLQTACLELNTELTAIITMTGLFFEQLLISKRIDVSNGTFEKKRDLEEKVIGCNVLVNKGSHKSLSKNIIRLRTQCKANRQLRGMQNNMGKFLKRKC